MGAGHGLMGPSLRQPAEPLLWAEFHTLKRVFPTCLTLEHLPSLYVRSMSLASQKDRALWTSRFVAGNCRGLKALEGSLSAYHHKQKETQQTAHIPAKSGVLGDSDGLHNCCSCGSSRKPVTNSL